MEKVLEKFRDELLPIANPPPEKVQVCVCLALCVYSVHIGVHACLQTLYCLVPDFPGDCMPACKLVAAAEATSLLIMLSCVHDWSGGYP